MRRRNLFFCFLVATSTSLLAAPNFYNATLEDKSGAKVDGDLAKQLAGLTLAKVEFRDATLPETLAFLTQQSTALSGGKITANFVIVAPPEATAKRVTLSLSSVPFLEVLRYLGDFTGTKFTIERYAIRVTAASAERPAN